MSKALKQQNWAELEEMLKTQADRAEKDAKSGSFIDALKQIKQSANPNGMTDAQRKIIIALFTNELEWEHAHSFNFILKMFPGYRKKLSSGFIDEHKLSELYKLISKADASKLIYILKSISKRRK